MVAEKKVWIDFEPIGRRIEAPAGTDLLTAAQLAGVQLSSVCGGIGSCDTCKVRLIQGRLSAPTLEEQAALTERELEAGFRLACQSLPQSDIKVDIPPESLAAPQRLQVEGQEVEIELDPPVFSVDFVVSPASISDLRADDARVEDALRQAGVKSVSWSYTTLQTLSDELRSAGWSLRAAVRKTPAGEQVVGMLPHGLSLLGLSVDIGSTKLAAYLVDLESGETLAKVGAMNPQVAYGEDVVSRIAYANQSPRHRQTLQDRLIDRLNEMVTDLCALGGAVRQQIVEAVVVGNTVMHHLFLGLPVRQLGEAPYVPAAAGALEILASEVGLELASGARIYLPPNVAGYVGADHAAMVLATGVWETDKIILALDIGTNTEITLAANGRLISCSTASGPVFEGAHVHDGMRAAPGAVERVQILEGEVRLQTIDHQAPVGVCGSGILDAVAEMLRVDMISASGRLHAAHELVKKAGDRQGLLLADAENSGHGKGIVIDRKDVHEIQLAKSAIRTGCQLLLKEAGLDERALDEIIVAGAFGTYIHIPSAVRVGMLPDLPLERYRQVGNAAGVGAKQMLLSMQRRHLAADLVRRIEYLELTTHPDFSEAFMRWLYF